MANGLLIAPVEVLHETKKRSDELHAWLKVRSVMFQEVDDVMQTEVAQVLSQFLRLVGERKLRTSADPFIIAQARFERLQLITDKKPMEASMRPNIPNVRQQLGMPWIRVLQPIRAKKWVVGWL